MIKDVFVMKMAEFKALPLEEQLLRLNKRLLEVKDVPGRLEDKFKNDEFDFGYSLLTKTAKSLGIKVDGKNYCAYKLDEEPPVVTDKQKVVKDKSIVKQQQVIVKQENVVKQSQEVVKSEEPQLTTDEILLVKALFKDKDNLVKSQQTLFVPQMMGAKKTTGISVYIELWERWNEFKKKYPMYSGTDLMALALEEFMERYDEGSDS